MSSKFFFEAKNCPYILRSHTILAPLCEKRPAQSLTVSGEVLQRIFSCPCTPPQQVNNFQPKTIRPIPKTNHQNIEGTLAIIIAMPQTARATPASLPSKLLSPSALPALLISSPLAPYYANAQQMCKMLLCKNTAFTGCIFVEL